MGIRKGTLLEKNIYKMFEMAGFNVKHQTIINGYEVDVYAEFNGYKIIIECKQYEKSPINVKNLIHQWHSKSSELSVNRTVIALYGFNPSKDDIVLAKKYGMLVWDEKDIDNYQNKVVDNKENGMNILLNDLGYNKNLNGNSFIISHDEILSDYVSLYNNVKFICGNLKHMKYDRDFPGVAFIMVQYDNYPQFALQNNQNISIHLKKNTFFEYANNSWGVQITLPSGVFDIIILNSNMMIVQLIKEINTKGLFNKNRFFVPKADYKYVALLETGTKEVKNLKLRQQLKLKEQESYEKKFDVK